ncbi:aminoacyl-tRNA hydrolase [Candidatus Dependentiae bacterium]|nr:aminoacyl-tRNA hydrolase [Candidatus Dependentiae bacterium]
MIKLVVGLGNPGDEYKFTRHNLGFMVIDRLKKKSRRPVTKRECYSQVFSANICRNRMLFIKPLTYMNLSGKAISCLFRKHDLLPEEMLIIVDDIALPFGEVRIKTRGSSGGHNGLESIIEHIETENFPRLRMGILNNNVDDMVQFVLSEFNKNEEKQLEELIDYAASCIKNIACKGIQFAQKYFNKKNLFKETEQI